MAEAELRKNIENELKCLKDSSEGLEQKLNLLDSIHQNLTLSTQFSSLFIEKMWKVMSVVKQIWIYGGHLNEEQQKTIQDQYPRFQKLFLQTLETYSEETLVQVIIDHLFIKDSLAREYREVLSQLSNFGRIYYLALKSKTGPEFTDYDTFYGQIFHFVVNRFRIGDRRSVADLMKHWKHDRSLKELEAIFVKFFRALEMIADEADGAVFLVCASLTADLALDIVFTQHSMFEDKLKCLRKYRMATFHPNSKRSISHSFLEDRSESVKRRYCQVFRDHRGPDLEKCLTRTECQESKALREDFAWALPAEDREGFFLDLTRRSDNPYFQGILIEKIKFETPEGLCRVAMLAQSVPEDHFQYCLIVKLAEARPNIIVDQQILSSLLKGSPAQVLFGLRIIHRETKETDLEVVLEIAKSHTDVEVKKKALTILTTFKDQSVVPVLCLALKDPVYSGLVISDLRLNGIESDEITHQLFVHLEKCKNCKRKCDHFNAKDTFVDVLFDAILRQPTQFSTFRAINGEGEIYYDLLAEIRIRQFRIYYEKTRMMFRRDRRPLFEEIWNYRTIEEHLESRIADPGADAALWKIGLYFARVDVLRDLDQVLADTDNKDWEEDGFFERLKKSLTVHIYPWRFRYLYKTLMEIYPDLNEKHKGEVRCYFKNYISKTNWEFFSPEVPEIIKLFQKSFDSSISTLADIPAKLDALSSAKQDMTV